MIDLRNARAETLYYEQTINPCDAESKVTCQMKAVDKARMHLLNNGDLSSMVGMGFSPFASTEPFII